MENKKAYTTISLIAIIFIGFILITILGIAIYGLNLADSSLSTIDFNLSGSNQTFNQTYNETLRVGIVEAKTSMPVIISTGVLIGMVVCMMFVGYKLPKTSPLWITLDIFILIVAEVVAVIIKENFQTLMNSSSVFTTIFSTTLQTGSKYILNLPIIIPVIGGLIMLVTYLTRDKNEGERVAY